MRPSTSLRRLAMLPILLVVLLVTPLTAGVAAADVATVQGDQVLLATEAEGEPVGPPVRGPDDENNVGAPEDYEPPFLWAASVLLLGGALTLIGVLGLLYYGLVVRPQRKAEPSS